MVSLADVLDRLPDAKQSGSGWVARCPAHEDHDPSLSLREEGGKLLLKCFAGCSFQEILTAAGFPLGRCPKPPVPPRPAPARRPHLPSKDELGRRRGLWLKWRKLFPGSAAEEYLLGRRIPPEVAQAAGAGYCPAGDWPGDPWPRVAFPLVRLIDGKARLISLAGRVIGDREDAKRWLYLTGPRGYFWTPGKAVTAVGDVVIVEGMVDALALAAAGQARAVALGGTNPPPDPTQLPGCQGAILAPDDDEAGRTALPGWINALQGGGLSVYQLRNGWGDGHKDAAAAHEAGLSVRLSING